MSLRPSLLLLCLTSCATLKAPDVDELKPAIERLHTRLRWKDFRGAADLIVPERRAAFIKARAKLKDERDLFISDYQLEDAQLAPDLATASAVSHMSWYRLPSNTELTVTITSVFAWRENTWLLESQDDGPFEDLKPAAEKLGNAPQPGDSLGPPSRSSDGGKDAPPKERLRAQQAGEPLPTK